MPRVSHFEDDHGRLPPGTTRCGYDADTMQSFFRDKDGRHFQSRPGNKLGPLEEVYRLLTLQETRMSGNAAQTAQVRVDHTHWKCLQDIDDGDVCLQQNLMVLKQCERCKAKRDVKDEALNARMTTIGKLVRVDKNGTEYWEYSDLETTVS
ncbi:hypothetical protein LB507_010033 [Fusarium sp. FIESC RH6]|nr:hypothetical protein LB507_010033 [Fusarium sp. FIESC RH6]